MNISRDVSRASLSERTAVAASLAEACSTLHESPGPYIASLLPSIAATRAGTPFTVTVPERHEPREYRMTSGAGAASSRTIQKFTTYGSV
jgi:hypothetical protein